METTRSLVLKARALLNKYSDGGTIIPDAELEDFLPKTIPIADMLHKELFESCKSDTSQEEPTTIESLDDATEINYKADQVMVFGLASLLATVGNQNLVQFFDDKYQRQKLTCANKAVSVQIEDVYSIGGDGFGISTD